MSSKLKNKLRSKVLSKRLAAKIEAKKNEISLKNNQNISNYERR